MKFVPTCAVTGLALVLSLGVTLRAQEKAAESKPAAKEGAAKEATAEGQKKATKKGDNRVPPNFAKLDLTAAQREKLYAIDSEYDAKLEALKEQIKALSEKRDADSEAVLTPAQKERLAQVRAESKKKTAERLEARKKEAAAKTEGSKTVTKPDAPKEGEAKKTTEGTAKPEAK